MTGGNHDVHAATAEAQEIFTRHRWAMTREGVELIREAELRAGTGEEALGAALNGDVVADRILREEAYARLASTEPIPTPIAYYLCFGKRSSPGHRRKDRANLYRDAILAAIVHRIVKRGFSPQRNQASREHPSACSIVADATHVGEAVVEKAWQRFGKWPEIASAPL